MSVDFCYIVSHGFAARMLLQTNLIGQLAEKGYKVALITLDIKDENLTDLASHSNVELIEWKTKNTIWDDDYLHKRIYFLEDINKNTALKEKFYNSLFYSKSLHPWKRIRPLFYYLIYLLVKLFPTIKKQFLKKEDKYLKSSEARSILKKLSPKLVISTYPVSIMEAKMLYESKNSDAETLLHLLSWDNITCKGKFPVLADRFIVWGDIMREELQEHYGIVGEKKVMTCGVPHFDEHVKIRETQTNKQIITDLGLDANLPYLFFAMSSPRFSPKEIDIVEWLSNAITKDVFGSRMQLIIRPHPQNVQTYTAKASWLTRLDKLTSQRVGIAYPSLLKSKMRWSMKKGDMLQLSELISGCSICLNSGSTVSIDALMHNKPVILTSFDGDAKIPYWNSARRLADYPHLKKLIAEGGALSINSYTILKTTILNYINNPDYNLVNRREALLRECYKDDGRSTERVISSLISTLNNVK